MTIKYWWHDVDFNPREVPLLRRGSPIGENVRTLQKRLIELGYDLGRAGADGDFGPATERAVIAFQRSRGLVDDGLVGEKTLLALVEKPDAVVDKFLKKDDLIWAANELNVELAAIMAVSEVESRGQGFFSNDRPAILFERHIMRRRLIAHGLNAGVQMERNPGIVNSSPGGYRGGVREYERLAQAKSIHHISALESCSWGAYQIMGFHAERLGYDTVQEMVDKMHISERFHLEAFVRFIDADRNLIRALRNLDWTTFARWYNGPNFAINKYDTKMANAFDRHARLLTAA